MTRPTLWARRGVMAPHWQLGDLGTVDPDRAWLLGWDAESDDGGVPHAVAQAIARALAASANVSFLRAGHLPGVATGWVAGDNGDLIQAAAPTGALGRVVDRLRGRQGPVTLVCSQRADAISGMFDEPAFPWWLQSQALLLSSPDAPPPQVTPEQVLALLDTDWVARAAALHRCGVLVVARPAVDGDALGLLALDSATAERLMASLAAHARAAGITWSEAG